MNRNEESKGLCKDWSLWCELSERMVAWESTHSATLSVTLSRTASGYRSFVDVDVRATFPVMTGPGLPFRLSLLSHYPHPKHTTLPSLLLELLDRLEKRANEEIYKQRELPLTPPAR